MRIKSVKLENFKSHASTYVSFSKGLNLIIGPNGSGKSSILQAIGLAFFGIRSKINLSQFITNSDENRDAVIKIEFVSEDDMNYTISKTILRSGNSRVLLTDENGLTVDSSSKINDMVKSIFQIKWGDPEKIYKNVITSYQNEITDIFTQTDAKRSEFFNTLFNTEIYKSISTTHVGNYERTLKDQLNDLKNEKFYIESDISQEKSIDEEIETNEKEIKEIESEFQIIETEKSKNEKIISEQTELDRKLKALYSQRDMMKVKIETYQKQLLKLEKEKEESEKALKNVNKSKEDYFRYNEISKKIKEKDSELLRMKKLLDEFQNVKDDMNKKHMEIEKINVSIESDRTRISENEESAKTIDDSVLSYLEKAKNFDLEALKKKYESTLKIVKYLKMLTDEKNYTELSNFFDNDNKGIFDETSAKIVNQEEFQKSILKINTDIAETNSKIQELKTAKSTLSDGICPYLKTRCLNVKEDPSGYFDPKINELSQRLSNLERDKSSVEDQNKQNEILIKKRMNLIDKLIEQSKQKSEEIYRDMTKAENDFEFEKKQIEDLKKRKTDLLKSVEILKIGISKKSSDIESSNSEIERLKLKISEESNLKNEIDTLETKRSEEQDEMQRLKAGYDLYNQNNVIALKFDGIKSEIENENVQKKVIEDELKRVLSDIQKDESDYDENELKRSKAALEELNKKENTLSKRLGELNGLLKGKLELKKGIEKRKERLLIVNSSIKKIDAKLSLSSNFRNLLNDMGSRISIVYRNLISSDATVKYDLLAGNSDSVEWGGNYDLHLISHSSESISDRSFEMLSGGEQVSVALSMRMAMAVFFSKAKFAIFDEPTVNLDSERRNALSESLPKLLDDMEQVIVVTHDDTFKEMTEKIIVLKNSGGKTTVEK